MGGNLVELDQCMVIYILFLYKTKWVISLFGSQTAPILYTYSSTNVLIFVQKCMGNVFFAAMPVKMQIHGPAGFEIFFNKANADSARGKGSPTEDIMLNANYARRNGQPSVVR